MNLICCIRVAWKNVCQENDFSSCIVWLCDILLLFHRVWILSQMASGPNLPCIKPWMMLDTWQFKPQKPTSKDRIRCDMLVYFEDSDGCVDVVILFLWKWMYLFLLLLKKFYSLRKHGEMISLTRHKIYITKNLGSHFLGAQNVEQTRVCIKSDTRVEGQKWTETYT